MTNWETGRRQKNTMREPESVSHILRHIFTISSILIDFKCLAFYSKKLKNFKFKVFYRTCISSGASCAGSAGNPLRTHRAGISLVALRPSGSGGAKRRCGSGRPAGRYGPPGSERYSRSNRPNRSDRLYGSSGRDRSALHLLLWLRLLRLLHLLQ